MEEVKLCFPLSEEKLLDLGAPIIRHWKLRRGQQYIPGLPGLIALNKMKKHEMIAWL